MDWKDAAECAYKKGYSEGYSRGKEESTETKKAEWLINPDGYYPYCSNCRSEPAGRKLTAYCPTCGSCMRSQLTK